MVTGMVDVATSTDVAGSITVEVFDVVNGIDVVSCTVVAETDVVTC